MAQKNKGTVLITGGAWRIGKSIAIALAQAGYAIALHYHTSIDQAQGTTKEIKSHGGRCRLFPCNLTDEATVQKLIGLVKRECPDLKVLINNASIFEPSSLIEYNLNSLNRHFVTNFVAPYILTAEFAKLCKKGNIINILDTHIVNNRAGHFDYLLSKKSLSAFTNMSAVALAPHIRVNAVAPGLILPPADKSTDYMERLAKKIPLKRRGNPQNITSAVAFLLDNDYLTGQTIFCDGGEHLL